MLSSYHIWHDPDTGADIWVFGDLTLTDVVPVPEPGRAALVGSGVALLTCLRRRVPA